MSGLNCQKPNKKIVKQLNNDFFIFSPNYLVYNYSK